ncbi:hypothetical protein [Thermophilibacter provencensis]|uniref:hypothetical protein n=1 Tax=Thermophilibacter provencensis TaxID=1852386 RepID=UPI00294377B5|nr:hypothetical protein [Thermophilibacter provencensis]
MASTNVSYPETNVTKAEDLAPEITIDYTNRFATGIKKLQKLLGITALTPVSSGATIKTYKYTTDIKDGNVAEGEYIPLSKVSKAIDQTYDLTLQKWRRNTTAEAIQEKGRSVAINETDGKFIAALQNEVKTDLFGAVTGTTKTSAAGENLQQALANMWGALTQIFEDYDGFADPDDDGADGRFVFFVNPLDVAEYLGQATITTQTAFGMSYLKNFLGLGTTFTTAKVTKGTVFGTAAQNLNMYYVPATGGDLAQTFGLTGDATGLIGMTHAAVSTNATIDTLVMGGWKIFPEISDAVLKGTISPQ